MPAIVAGTPQARVLRRAFPQMQEPSADELFIDNRNASATCILLVNGNSKRIGPGQTLEVDASATGGPIVAYTMDATVATGANDVTVYEKRHARPDPREGSYREG